MVLEDQYGVGDVIDTGVAIGTVEFVSLRMTRIRDADGVPWYIPNGEIKKVGNFSKRIAAAPATRDGSAIGDDDRRSRPTCPALSIDRSPTLLETTSLDR